MSKHPNHSPSHKSYEQNNTFTNIIGLLNTRSLFNTDSLDKSNSKSDKKHRNTININY